MAEVKKVKEAVVRDVGETTLVAETRFHVSIQAVVRDVGETALEPLPTNRNRQTSMEIGFRFANTEHKHGN